MAVCSIETQLILEYACRALYVRIGTIQMSQLCLFVEMFDSQYDRQFLSKPERLMYDMVILQNKQVCTDALIYDVISQGDI